MVEEMFAFPQDTGPKSAKDAVNDEEAARAALQEELEKQVKVLEQSQKEKEELEKLVKPLTVDSNTKDNSDKEVKITDNLAHFVKTCFESSEAARKHIELSWIEALKRYKGIYEADVVAKISPNRSRAFVRVTRTKVKTVDSRLADLLFPANGDKNWDITPTPLPEMSDARKQAIIQLYEQENNQKITPETLDMLISQEASKQAKKMSKVISDQLVELRYRDIMKNVIHSGNVYGTGILKGPLAAITENKQYYKYIGDDNKERWLLKDYNKVIPFAEYVRIWDIYPDMEATDFRDCRYIVQRRKMNKHDLISLAKRSDFSSDIIYKYIANNPEGKYDKKDFEVQLQTMGDIISSSDGDYGKNRKYELLEFWGYVDAKLLEGWGVSIPEDKRGMVDIPANVWVLGDRVIKAILHPLEGIRWPYYVYYYDKDETSIFGEGIPSIMKDMQELTNSAFRAMLDNAAISAGPQVEINEDLLSEDEDPREIHPFKVWLRTGQGADAANPCIRVLSYPSFTPEFERMLNMFSNYSDEITTIPKYMWGEASGAAGRTAGGLSMLMASANMAIKDQVKNFDDGITTPFISAMYHWNMQFNENEDIKGDYAVVAQGSASLIAKEMYTQYLIQFLNITNNPVDSNIIRRPEIIRSIADAFDLKSETFVMSDKEIQSQQQAQQQQQQQQQEFMYNIIEAAREEGVSPEALINSMRQLQQQQLALIQAQQQQMQQQQQVLMR